MSLTLPLALLGLLGLPLLAWLHRRLSDPPRTVVPSLQFFTEDAGALVRSDRRRRDVDLWLTLLAGALLALAAAGPTLLSPTLGRRVRVVVAGGAAASQHGYADRVERALRDLRAALDPADQVDVVGWPLAAGEDRGVRPSAASLAALAEASEAGLALVFSDAWPEPAPAGVRWVALADAGATNLGIVAADVEPQGDDTLLFVNVLNHARRAVRAVVRVSSSASPPAFAARERRVTLPPDGHAALEERLPGSPTGLGDLRVHVLADESDFVDALPADDAVELSRRPLVWRWSGSEQDATVPAALRAAFSAALGPQGARQSPAAPGAPEGVVDLEVLESPGSPRAKARARLWLPARTGGPALRMLAGESLGVRPHPLTADVTLGGATLAVSSPGAPAPASGRTADVLLSVSDGAERLPLLTVAGALDDAEAPYDVWLHARPDLGSPPLIDVGFWPVLLENLAGVLLGSEGRAGLRRRGVLDPATSRLGRRVVPFPVEVLAGVAPQAGRAAFSLRAPVAVLGVTLLVWLWRRQSAGLAPAPRAAGTMSR